jgi:hypothetical protein
MFTVGFITVESGKVSVVSLKQKPGFSPPAKYENPSTRVSSACHCNGSHIATPFRTDGLAHHTGAGSSTPSGKPFHAHFTDIADHAGLRYSVICGELGHSDCIMETNGTGCAFIDFDSDGWIDLFVLTGTRRSGAPEGTSNRLYKNNRDGTFTDVTEKAGLHRLGWASSVTVGDYNDGLEDQFCTY